MPVCILPLFSSWLVLPSLDLLSYSLPRPSVVSSRPLCVCGPPEHTPKTQLTQSAHVQLVQFILETET